MLGITANTDACSFFFFFNGRLDSSLKISALAFDACVCEVCRGCLFCFFPEACADMCSDLFIFAGFQSARGPD